MRGQHPGVLYVCGDLFEHRKRTRRPQKAAGPRLSSSSQALVFFWEGVCVSAQSCLTLCDPVDCSPPGSSVRGILQARTLEWVAIPFSRGSS